MDQLRRKIRRKGLKACMTRALPLPDQTAGLESTPMAGFQRYQELIELASVL